MRFLLLLQHLLQLLQMLALLSSRLGLDDSTSPILFLEIGADLDVLDLQLRENHGKNIRFPQTTPMETYNITLRIVLFSLRLQRIQMPLSVTKRAFYTNKVYHVSLSYSHAAHNSSGLKVVGYRLLVR